MKKAIKIVLISAVAIFLFLENACFLATPGL